MRIRPVFFGVLVLAIFLGTVGVAAASGNWATTGMTTGGGRDVTLSGISVTEIKGWMAIGDVADAWGVPLAEALAAFDLPADTAPSTPLKDLESDAFTVSALREWLAAGAP